MDTVDPSLLDRARRKDPAAMDALLTQYEHSVYRFALRMCGEENAAQEVLQQTLLTAFQQLHTFRGDAKLSTWLYQIARSFCVKSRRRRVDEPATHEPLHGAEALGLASPAEDPEARTHARELSEALSAAILALPPDHREALVLRDVEGLSAEEAAEVVGIEVGNLKSRLHRARLELRQNLSTLLEPGGTSHQCAALSEALVDFAAEDIDKATCERIEQHLAQCPHCGAACDALKRTVSLCRRIPGDEVPAPVRAAVRQALRESLPAR